MTNQIRGGLVTAVEGPAAAAGLLPGDRILAVDGVRLRDVIDFRFYADGSVADFSIVRGTSEFCLSLDRSEGADWGIEFVDPLFDRVRRCTNRCIFCFLDQLPQGWRRSLYLRDDDYRLSFLFGNFVTLTNLREQDWVRLEEQRLSPLYVSVHATDLGLRRQLLGRQNIPDVRQQLDRLGRMGISVHAQVVLCPGINDGSALEQTIADLAGRSSTVLSLALVPVGLTRFRDDPPPGLEGVSAELRSYTSPEAWSLLHWALPRQRAFRQKLGQGFLYLSDEFYLLAGRSVPAARFYDGFPQLENGVGLVRQLRDDWFRTRRRLPSAWPHRRRFSLICGTLIAPQLRQMLSELVEQVDGLQGEILAVENDTFGPTVTVSGLLTGETLLRVLAGADLGELVFFPRAAFDDQGAYTLDGVSLGTLQEQAGRPIVLVERMSQVLHTLEVLEKK